MADDRKDSVGDQWTGTGNGTTITLDNVALNGMRAASGTLVDGATYNYRIQNAANTEWEDNRGVYTASGITLVRGTPTASSNAGSRVSFSAGVKAVVFGPQARDCDIPNAATGANIASASTVDLTARTGGRVHITGTTTITAITLGRGPVTLIFDGILTLTHHATNNALPGAANITTAAGDRAIYESDGTTVYCVDFIRAGDVATTNNATQTLTNKTLTTPVINGFSGDTSAITIGTNQFVKDTSGNLGLGTASPGKRLDVQGVGTNAAVRLKETGSFGVSWDINVGAANAMNFTNDAGSALDYSFTNGNVRPGSDNALTCGAPSFRWSTVYAGTGAINTSDAREKTVVAAMTDAEIAASKALASEIGTFKFLASIQSKGAAARSHIGMTVQRAIEVMQAHGLDPLRYAFICYDQWDAIAPVAAVQGRDAVPAVLDEAGNVVTPEVSAIPEQPAIPGREAGDRYGFRMDELNSFILRGIAARLDALEAP